MAVPLVLVQAQALGGLAALAAAVLRLEDGALLGGRPELGCLLLQVPGAADGVGLAQGREGGGVLGRRGQGLG